MITSGRVGASHAPSYLENDVYKNLSSFDFSRLLFSRRSSSAKLHRRHVRHRS